MNRIKLTSSFYLDEFVPKEIITQFGVSAQWFIDRKIIVLAQAIRDHFDKSMTINNWFHGGQFSERGFRTPTTTTGGKLSQHRFGRAIDFNIAGLTDDEVFSEIMKNESKFMGLGLTTLEDCKITNGWTHADIRYTGSNKILIVKP